MTDLTRPEPPTASTRRLLVVDFDFFFPNPLDAGVAGSDLSRVDRPEPASRRAQGAPGAPVGFTRT
jgi:hypothetical protein